jgi:hypothetical protein
LIAGVLCLGFFTAARAAEQVRSGINALGNGQRGAGLALVPKSAAGLSSNPLAGRLSQHRTDTDVGVILLDTRLPAYRHISNVEITMGTIDEPLAYSQDIFRDR